LLFFVLKYKLFFPGVRRAWSDYELSHAERKSDCYMATIWSNNCTVYSY